MCLVEFGSLTDSLYAMGKLQGIEVGGKKMRLSFTRSRPKKNQNSPNHKFNDPFSWVLHDMLSEDFILLLLIILTDV
mgnify:CR=1 FL=1